MNSIAEIRVEPDYWTRGSFFEGYRHNLFALTDLDTLPVGTKLYTKQGGIDHENHLLNLLSRIHRDGGHYTQEHGIEKSVQDADLKVAEIYSKISDLESDLRVVTSLYADAVNRNVLFTERLENRAVNLTNEQRDILTRMIINTVNTY